MNTESLLAFCCVAILGVDLRCSKMRSSNTTAATGSMVLISYRLSPEMERQFCSDSSRVSEFWINWKSDNVSSIHLAPEKEPPRNRKSFQDEYDAQMTVYSAYGENGVYFLFDIIDDCYPGRLLDADSWIFDVVDLCLVKDPASKFYSRPEPHLAVMASPKQMSSTMVQIQCPCGGRVPPDSANFNYFDDSGNSGGFFHICSAKDTACLHGIRVRIIRMNDVRRIQEWFIPYKWVGHPGMGARPTRGTRVAMAIGYNDFDTTDLLNQGISKKLTWEGKGSPFSEEGAWGDLEFGPRIEEREKALPKAAIQPDQFHACPEEHLSADTLVKRAGPKSPPMGWNTWNAFGSYFTEDVVKESIDSMLSKGLLRVGYTYVNLDGGGTVSNREMEISRYVHGKGFEFGVYANHLPEYNILRNEIWWTRRWSFWQIDFLKYDAFALPLHDPTWIAMRDALWATKREIVYSIHCQDSELHRCLPTIANMWRTGPDIYTPGERPSFRKVLRNAFLNYRGAELAARGHWNDPDFLLIGIRDGLTHEEERTQFSLWAISAAPLLIGCDIRKISDSSLSILKNREVITVDQDTGDYQGRIVKSSQAKSTSVWAKEMSDGSCAILLLNTSTSEGKVGVLWSDIGRQGNLFIRDLWSHKNLGFVHDGITQTVPSNGSALLRAWRNRPGAYSSDIRDRS